MQELSAIEFDSKRVLTTKQIAVAYGTTEDKIRWNFNYNKKKYKEGKHYICLQGHELRKLKRTCEYQTLFKQAKIVYLWTEKGALLHAKSLNTDKAWEVYDYLVDFYFRAKENQGPEASGCPQVIKEPADWLEYSLKDAMNKAYQRRIGYCQGVVQSILENERGDVGSIMALYSLLSDAGKRQAVELIQEVAGHEQ